MFGSVDRELLSTYVRPQWPRAALLAFLLFSGIGLQLANPLIASSFIDAAQRGAPFGRLLRIALVFLGVALFTQVVVIADTYVADDLGWRTTNVLRADLTRHVLSLDGSFHARHGAGELIERVDGDVSAIANFFSRFVLQVIGSGVFLVGVLAVLLREDLRIGALMTAFALGASFYLTKGGRTVGLRAREVRQATGAFSGYIEERLGGLPDIKTRGADDYAMLRLHERSAKRYHANARAASAISNFNASVSLFFVFGTASALGLSTFLYTRDAITLGTIYVVYRYAVMLRLPLTRLTRQMSSLQQATGGIIRVRELLGTTSTVSDGAGVNFDDGSLPVTFDGVWFAYGDEPVLKDVSFRLEAGEVLGLLGRTGSGKTTISRLLFRLHDVDRGVIRLGSHDVRDTRIDDLRTKVALVTQDVQLFHATLRDNVRLFDPSVSDEQLLEVFGGLELDPWLRSLPDGLDTMLGAGARGLSAGEGQLVALARVFLKDPALVVLDEASSRLDPATERLLERAITHLLEGRTGVVIAHRLATVHRADKICVLEDGRVVEFGRRAELASDGDSRFARLLRAGATEVLA